MFGRGWEAAQGTIVARKVSKGLFGTKERGGVDRRIAYDYVVDVRPADGGPMFRATFAGPYDNHTEQGFQAPEVGQAVGVQYNPKTHEVRFDQADRAVYRDGHSAGGSESDAFDAIAEAPPGSPAAPSPLEASDPGGPPAEPAAALSDQPAALAAIVRAKASGNEAEVDRLQAELKQRAAENP